MTSMEIQHIHAQFIDITAQRIFPALVSWSENGILKIQPQEHVAGEGPLPFLLPGFIDAHVHIESSMLVPAEFAKLAVVHGTIGTVSDPHEIANVCGIEGVEFMIRNGNTVPFYFNFGAPSCVPATGFETAGAELTVQHVDQLLQKKEIKYLSEMMNFPGVLNADEIVMGKIALAKRYNKPVDGHAPGLRGEQAAQYIAAGISTDHECFTREEAEEKLRLGMHILIREGSAAKNFDALIGLLDTYPEKIMFCSDDKHPDSLVAEHINELCARAVKKGVDVFKVLRAACVNPVLHYRLDSGLVREGDPADFILLEDLENFNVRATYIHGKKVASMGTSLIDTPRASATAVNNFSCTEKAAVDFDDKHAAIFNNSVVIEALDGQLITGKYVPENGASVDVGNDILKIVVVNRYRDAPPAVAFVKNFGLQKGAIASSVAHDSHNIVAVGVDDCTICEAVNAIIRNQGGISLSTSGELTVVPLPVAGLMSAADGYDVARQYSAIDNAAKRLGAKLSSPFMTLSFMALLVIPHLKLSDKGLFDGDDFRLV